jgi:hypothetical protein
VFGDTRSIPSTNDRDTTSGSRAKRRRTTTAGSVSHCSGFREGTTNNDIDETDNMHLSREACHRRDPPDDPRGPQTKKRMRSILQERSTNVKRTSYRDDRS